MITDLGADAIFKIVAYVVVTLLLGVAGHSVIRRRVSKDNVAVASDHGHIDILDVLRKERDALNERLDKITKERDEALHAHSQAMLEIGGLRKEVEHLTHRIGQQTAQILAQSIRIEGLERKSDALNGQIRSLMGLKEAGLPPFPEEGSNE